MSVLWYFVVQQFRNLQTTLGYIPLVVDGRFKRLRGVRMKHSVVCRIIEINKFED